MRRRPFHLGGDGRLPGHTRRGPRALRPPRWNVRARGVARYSPLVLRPLQLAWPILLIGCPAADRPADSGAEGDAGDGESLPFSWTLSPSDLDFGAAAIGVEGSVELTLENAGSEELLVLSAELSTDAVALTTPFEDKLSPGERTIAVATWTPLDTLSLFETLTLRLSGAGELVRAPISVSGRGVGAMVTASATTADLGEVPLGCSASTLVTVGNVGNEALHVEGVDLDDGGFFVLDSSADPPPWTIESGETRTFSIEFLGYVEGEAVATATVRSTDRLNPRLDVEVRGTGGNGVVIEEEHPIRPIDRTTGIFGVNAVINVEYAARFASALPTFFETLSETGIPYRVAFVHLAAGTVDGDLPWIDESMDPAAAAVAALDMVAGATGDDDGLFFMLDAAIDANRSWLIDESEAWAAAPLNLVGINDDQEQSGINATVFIDGAQRYKPFGEDVAVHGLGGDYPSGCDDTVPAKDFYEATVATGGLFQSICPDDWGPSMEALALAFVAPRQVPFPLQAVPVEWSLEVLIDGAPLTEGWTWDAGTNAIALDADHFPAEGSVVVFRYFELAECGESV